MNMRGNQTAAELKVSKFYEYHNATKHTVQRLYSSGHRLDWASQPNPFLHYDGTELIDLPRQFQVSTTDYFATVASLAENAKARVCFWHLNATIFSPRMRIRFVSETR